MATTLQNVSPSSVSSFTTASPKTSSVIPSKQSMFEKVMEPVVDALVEAFADALVKGLEGLMNKAIDDIGKYIDGGQKDDAFQPAPSHSGNTGGVAHAPAWMSPGFTPGPFTASQLSQTIDRMNVERHASYQPGGSFEPSATFAQDALRNFGVPGQSVPVGTANQMSDWLNTKGLETGWIRVGGTNAQEMALQGRPTIAAWKNPTGGPGHVGVVRPGQMPDGSPSMAQAGARNFSNGTVAQGFGNALPEYFAYVGPSATQQQAPAAASTHSSATAPTSSGASASAGLTSTSQVRGSNNLSGFRTDKYDSLIREMAAKYKVPARLIKCVIEQESRFKPTAGSPKGARGLMQLMPGTARELGVRNSLDPRQNIEGGTKYLARMLKMFKGDVPRALAAYNAGPGNVIKHRGIPPFRETRTYVRNIMANYNKA